MSVIKSVAEHKYRDTSILQQQPLGPTVDGLVTSLVDIPSGLLDVNRIGDKVTGLSLQLTCSIFSPHIATLSDSIFIFRILVFIWKDDTPPVRDDILTIGAAGLPALLPNLWFLNHDKKVKRKLLLDKTFVAADQSVLNVAITYSTAYWRPHIAYKVYIPLSKYKRDAIINYDGNTTNGTNKIYCLTLANLSAGNQSQSWNVVVASRYNYIDM